MCLLLALDRIPYNEFDRVQSIAPVLNEPQKITFKMADDLEFTIGKKVSESYSLRGRATKVYKVTSTSDDPRLKPKVPDAAKVPGKSMGSI